MSESRKVVGEMEEAMKKWNSDKWSVKKTKSGLTVLDKTQEAQAESPSDTEAENAYENEPTTRDSGDEAKHLESTEDLENDDFYLWVALLLKHVKPETVPAVVEVIVQEIAAYNERLHTVEYVEGGDTVSAGASESSHGKRKTRDARAKTEDQGSPASGLKAIEQEEVIEEQGSIYNKGKGRDMGGPTLDQASEQLNTLQQATHLAPGQDEHVIYNPQPQGNVDVQEGSNRHALANRQHVLRGIVPPGDPLGHGRAMREQILNPADNPWDAFFK